MLTRPHVRAATVLLAALALGSCGGTNRISAAGAAKLVSERFVSIEGVQVRNVTCQRYGGVPSTIAYLCQTGVLDGRPVDALVTQADGASAEAAPTLSVGRLERLIEGGGFAHRAGVPVLAASCPRGSPYLRGAVTTCEVAFLGGEHEPALVTQRNATGAIELTSPNYIATKLEQTIGARLAPHHIDAAVHCPRRVAIAPSARFDCRLSGRHGRVRVVATDATGGVRFQLQAR